MAENKNPVPVQGQNQTNTSSSGLKTILTGAVVALIFLGMGTALGFVLSKPASPLPAPETKSLLNELQETPVVTGINVIAAGVITEINNRDITLKRNEKSLTVTIRNEESTIGRITNPESENPDVPEFPQMHSIDFEDLKIGDPVSVTAIIKDDNKIEGVSVTVVPDESMLPRLD